MRFTCLDKSARFFVFPTDRFASFLRYQSSNNIDANLVGTRTNSSAKGIYLVHIYPNLKPLEVNQELQPGLIRTLESNLSSSVTSLLLVMTSASISRPDLWSLQLQWIMTPSDNGQRHYSQWWLHNFINYLKRSWGKFALIIPPVKYNRCTSCIENTLCCICNGIEWLDLMQKCDVIFKNSYKNTHNRCTWCCKIITEKEITNRCNNYKI